MTRHNSRPAAHFAALYARDPDPWGFATSAYEDEKYRATLAALPARRFRSGFEAGCSIGVLTRRLAARCDALLAVDIIQAALADAAARCRDLPHVSFARRTLPHEWPAGPFDLIVLSEILYFLSPEDIGRMARHSAASLTADGTVLLVNFTGATDDPCSGDEAAEIFRAAAPALCAGRSDRHENYRIDLLVRDAG